MPPHAEDLLHQTFASNKLEIGSVVEITVVVDVPTSAGHARCSKRAPHPHAIRVPHAQRVTDDEQRMHPPVSVSPPQHVQRPSG